MFYPELIDNENTRETIAQWSGYNHNFYISDGEFYDMENLTSDYYPLLAPRKPRDLLKKVDNLRGILFTNSDLVYLHGTELFFQDKEYDLSPYMSETEHTSRQQIIKYGAYILIFPLGLYFNTANTADMGALGEKLIIPKGVEVKYTICDQDGNDLNAADASGHRKSVTVAYSAPDDPEGGDYWLNTNKTAVGLYMFDSASSAWVGVGTTYVRIDTPGTDLSAHFSEGDAVYMNSVLTDLNNGSIIQKVSGESMVVIGLIDNAVQLTQETNDQWQLTIERRIPELDFVCVNDNRVWGCYYGKDVSGNVVNEIYCSKLGDAKNWYCYAGLTTDSYAVSIGIDGVWTGCVSYNGYPTFFKENCILRIYGSYPSQYQLITTNCRGVQEGSDRSIAIVGEYLIYKSVSDICVFDGSSPSSISSALGKDMVYYDAVAGGCLNKYYICMTTDPDSTNPDREYTMFVYDMAYNMWHKEDHLHIEGFSSTNSGQMYGYSNIGIYGFGTKDNILYLTKVHDEDAEDYVPWYAITGLMGLEYPDHKFIDRFTLRAYIPFRSELEIAISYDDGPWEILKVLRGNARVNTQTFTFPPKRCDHYQLRFKGHGDVRIYTLSRTLDTGSEE